jgi:hypothetical protein
MAHIPLAGTWAYRSHHGFLGYTWPNGIDQVPSLVGTIVRAQPHDGGAAGVTASFIAVKLT